MSKPFIPATNRQKKVLRLFEVGFNERDINRGQAGVIINDLFHKHSKDKWHRYLYLTDDFSNESSDLIEFEPDSLSDVKIPRSWSHDKELQRMKDSILEEEYKNGSPYDLPFPELQFEGNEYVFTGNFIYGSRKNCQSAVTNLSAVAKSSVSLSTHVVVVGEKGSSNWSSGKYGKKIELAVINRNEFGTPVIVPESHWVASLNSLAIP